MEASGRGSSHGHWELWGVSLTMQSAIEEFARKPGQMFATEEVTKRRGKNRRRRRRR